MAITRIIATWFSNYDSKTSLGSRLRRKRVVPLLEMIDEVFQENGYVNLIDLGGEANYWNIVPSEYLDACNVSITIVNLPGTKTPEAQGAFKYVDVDACDLSSFGDKSFHIAHSNSVLEHVGDWQRMKQFSFELSRVSQKYFVQTPNYWFPVEPHFLTPFFHWLPKPVRMWLVLHFQLGHQQKANSIDQAVRIVEGSRLLNRKMVQALFKDARVLTEWYFWLPKSFIAVKK